MLAERVRLAGGDFDDFIAAIQGMIATGIDIKAMAMRYVTACEYRLPNGAAIDGCGVVPDVVVARTSEEPHHGHLEDPDVEAARAVLERA